MPRRLTTRFDTLEPKAYSDRSRLELSLVEVCPSFTHTLTRIRMKTTGGRHPVRCCIRSVRRVARYNRLEPSRRKLRATRRWARVPVVDASASDVTSGRPRGRPHFASSSAMRKPPVRRRWCTRRPLPRPSSVRRTRRRSPAAVSAVRDRPPRRWVVLPCRKEVHRVRTPHTPIVFK